MTPTHKAAFLFHPLRQRFSSTVRKRNPVACYIPQERHSSKDEPQKEKRKIRSSVWDWAINLAAV